MARTLTEQIRLPKPRPAFIPGSAARWHWLAGAPKEHQMKERKTLFRRVFESMIEGRTKLAQRHINEYLRAYPVKNEWRR